MHGTTAATDREHVNVGLSVDVADSTVHNGKARLLPRYGTYISLSVKFICLSVKTIVC